MLSPLLNVFDFKIKKLKNSSCFEIMHLPSQADLWLLLIKLILLIPGRLFQSLPGSFKSS